MDNDQARAQVQRKLLKLRHGGEQLSVERTAMVARYVYWSLSWRERALTFLERELLPNARPFDNDELEILTDPDGDSWDYFLIFGICPDTKGYVERTRTQLLEMIPGEQFGLEAVARTRLKWSAKEILGGKA